MELKNILSKLGSSKEEKPEAFLALEVSTETVKSAVWSVKEGKTTILKTGSIEEWQEDSKESLITAVDSSITNAFEGVEPEPNKVIFGLPESWAKGQEITEEKKEILKTICQKLELKPLGFVVTLESLIVYLKKEKGTPVNAIFINLSETESIISLVKFGKIVGSQVVGRSDDLAADVREGLARIGKLKDLPSQMILFNGITNFEEAKQQLISFDWLENLSFLHFPKVKTLEVLEPVKAVAIAGGAEVAKSLGFEIKEEEKEETEEKEEKLIKKKDRDKDEKIDEPTELEKIDEATAADLGFVLNKDIVKLKKSAEEPEVYKEGKREEKEKEVVVTRTKEDQIEIRRSKLPLGFFKNINKVLVNFFIVFKKIFKKIPKLSFKKGPILIVLPLVTLVLLFLAGLVFYWYVPKAEVIIYLKPKVLETELELLVDSTESSVDEEKGIVPGSQQEIEVEGEKSKETTGEKLVGEKAKGKVIIYNKTEVAKTFEAATTLVGGNNLSFSLNEEVTVASKSAETTDEGEQVSYGKVTASVTANSIGQESNLDAGEQLSFKDYPTSVYSAKVESGLTEGTSRQIKAVSEEDLSSLLDDLTKELKDKAGNEIKLKLTSGQELLDKEVSSQVVDKDYNAEEDDEVDNLSLKLKLVFKFLTYKKDDFLKILTKKLSQKIPSDFVFDPEAVEIDVKEIELEDETANVKMVAKSNLLPQLDVDNIKSNIKGRYPQVIEEYFSSLPNFSKADIKITPNLPGKLNTLPRLINNIEVKVKREGD